MNKSFAQNFLTTAITNHTYIYCSYPYRVNNGHFGAILGGSRLIPYARHF